MTENTTKATEAEYLIYAAQPEGFTYVLDNGLNDPLAAKPGRVEYGESLRVTPGLIRQNTNRLGVCWMEHTEADQLAEYGKLRFGYGEVPPSIVAEVAAARRARLEEQRRNLLANSHAAARYNSEREHLNWLDAELAALDVEAQG
jgi:hypothetical protein